MNILIFLLFITFSSAADGLKIFVFDVGQGDSQLLLFPSGYSILIDAGEPGGTTNQEGVNGKYLAKRIEEILGKKKIDVFVLTHYHIDHMGGYEIGGIWYLIEKAWFTIGKYVKRHIGTFKGKFMSECKKSTIDWRYVGEMSEKAAKFVCYVEAFVAPTKLSKFGEHAHRCDYNQIKPPDSGAEVGDLELCTHSLRTQSGTEHPCFI